MGSKCYTAMTKSTNKYLKRLAWLLCHNRIATHKKVYKFYCFSELSNLSNDTINLL